MASAQEKIWYDGSCHCRAIQFKIHVPPLTGPEPHKVVQCTCSICTANGYVFVYVGRDDVEWTKGYDSMKEYRQFSKLRCHKFCGNCGSSILVDMHGHHPLGDVLGFNVRMIRGINLKDLTYNHFDGRNMVQPEYNDEFPI